MCRQQHVQMAYPHQMLKLRPELCSSLRLVPGRVTLCSTSVFEGYVHDPEACLHISIKNISMYYARSADTLDLSCMHQLPNDCMQQQSNELCTRQSNLCIHGWSHRGARLNRSWKLKGRRMALKPSRRMRCVMTARSRCNALPSTHSPSSIVTPSCIRHRSGHIVNLKSDKSFMHAGYRDVQSKVWDTPGRRKRQA
jgi:hypothetical protein